MTEESSRARDDSSSTAGTFVFVLLGPIVWALHLAVVYGMQISCAAAASRPSIGETLALAVLGATAAALAFLAVAAWRSHAAARMLRVRASRFLERVMRLLILLSVVGIAWVGTAALVLPACLQLR